MKQNQVAFTNFTIAETVQCFTQKAPGSLVEEADIVNHLLQEMVNRNLAEITEASRLAIDYP